MNPSSRHSITSAQHVNPRPMDDRQRLNMERAAAKRGRGRHHWPSIAGRVSHLPAGERPESAALCSAGRRPKPLHDGGL